jgi:hypothetical protein
MVAGWLALALLVLLANVLVVAACALSSAISRREEHGDSEEARPAR